MTDATTSLSPQDGALHRQAVNSPARVLFASLVGTTIEFFDFYVYATAAVIIFPHLFFPAADPTWQCCSPSPPSRSPSSPARSAP